jgi:hypothetical protein
MTKWPWVVLFHTAPHPNLLIKKTLLPTNEFP